MTNRKQYQVVTLNGKYRAGVVGQPDAETRYLSAGTTEAAAAEVAEMNAKFYLSDYAPEEIEAFWQSMDIAPVNKFFSDLLKLPVNLEKEKSAGKSRIYYSLYDGTNIAAQSPITNAAWKTMTVGSFSSGLTVDEGNGDLYFWADIHFSYEHWSGGRNGASIGNVLYKNGNWEIESGQQNYEARNKAREVR